MRERPDWRRIDPFLLQLPHRPESGVLQLLAHEFQVDVNSLYNRRYRLKHSPSIPATQKESMWSPEEDAELLGALREISERMNRSVGAICARGARLTYAPVKGRATGAESPLPPSAK